jgi:hypothetical protein
VGSAARHLPVLSPSRRRFKAFALPDPHDRVVDLGERRHRAPHREPLPDAARMIERCGRRITRRAGGQRRIVAYDLLQHGQNRRTRKIRQRIEGREPHRRRTHLVERHGGNRIQHRRVGRKARAQRTDRRNGDGRRTRVQALHREVAGA